MQLQMVRSRCVLGAVEGSEVGLVVDVCEAAAGIGSAASGSCNNGSLTVLI